MNPTSNAPAEIKAANLTQWITDKAEISLPCLKNITAPSSSCACNQGLCSSWPPLAVKLFYDILSFMTAPPESSLGWTLMWLNPGNCFSWHNANIYYNAVQCRGELYGCLMCVCVLQMASLFNSLCKTVSVFWIAPTINTRNGEPEQLLCSAVVCDDYEFMVVVPRTREPQLIYTMLQTINVSAGVFPALLVCLRVPHT